MFLPALEEDNPLVEYCWRRRSLMIQDDVTLSPPSYHDGQYSIVLEVPKEI